MANKGKWVTYSNGECDFLYNDLKLSSEKWYLNSKSDCRRALFGKNLEIYYEDNGNGFYNEAKILIKSYGDRIDDIYGSNNGYNVDFDLLDILEEKLFTEKITDNYLERINQKFISKLEDMKKLREIDIKNKNNLDLSIEDLMFLYEIGTKKRIKSFGIVEDPNIELIRRKRSDKDDFYNLHITNVTPKMAYNFGLERVRDSRCFNNVRSLKGLLVFNNLNEVEGFNNLRSIEGIVSFPKVKNSKGLEKLSKVTGYIDLSHLEEVDNLEKLRKVKGILDLSGLNEDLKLSSIKDIEDYDASDLIDYLKRQNTENTLFKTNKYVDMVFIKKMLYYCNLAEIDMNESNSQIIRGNIKTNKGKILLFKKEREEE